MTYESIIDDLKKQIKEKKAELKTRKTPLKDRTIESLKSLGTTVRSKWDSLTKTVRLRWMSYMSKQFNITMLEEERDELTQKLAGDPVKGVFTKYFRPETFIKMLEAKNKFLKTSLTSARGIKLTFEAVRQNIKIPAMLPKKSENDHPDETILKSMQFDEIEKTDPDDASVRPKRRLKRE